MASFIERGLHPAVVESYDGTADTLVDTHIRVDCIDPTSSWHDRASPLHVNLIIYCELLIPGPDVDALDALLDVYGTRRTPLPWSSASLTAAVYGQCLRRGGSKQNPLPDFFMGAHAAVSSFSVLTRHPKPYNSYFARLKVISL